MGILSVILKNNFTKKIKFNYQKNFIGYITLDVL